MCGRDAAGVDRARIHRRANRRWALAVWSLLILVPQTWDCSAGYYGLTNKLSEHDKSLIRLSTMSGVRTDTRRSMDARPVTLEAAVLPDAFGSARVRMGRTEVIAAVKAEFSKPHPAGRIGPGPLVFHVDLRGIAGDGFSTVPRDDDEYVDDYALTVCRTLEVSRLRARWLGAGMRHTVHSVIGCGARAVMLAADALVR
jgi:hypothetical protein